ncbi:hypothetical protein CJ014_00890 [Pleomorphomonas carboxyditropha]|uniref:Uncharacterized protein n=1 Tax=Pleomorphomonas carboxyditropha TaxID=2023338 RepID=A0A2G9X2B6_9HYPH|nr:hypothetical protein CJ014_00890 [Pleomorphomonas carboxyditropha]
MTWTSIIGLFVVTLAAVVRGLESVAQTALVTLPVVIGSYMGIGHADYRVAIKTDNQQSGEQS